MSNNSFDRNYGMIKFGREFWGGDNGLVTVVVKLPADVEVGETALPQDGSDETQTAKTHAERNLFKITQVLNTRGVIVSASVLKKDADVTKVSDFKKVGGNVLAYHEVGSQVADSFAITYLVERANVFDTQDGKPGAIIDLSVNPTELIAKQIAAEGFFDTKAGVKAGKAEFVAVKVFDALPALVL